MSIARKAYYFYRQRIGFFNKRLDLIVCTEHHFPVSLSLSIDRDIVTGVRLRVSDNLKTSFGKMMFCAVDKVRPTLKIRKNTKHTEGVLLLNFFGAILGINEVPRVPLQCILVLNQCLFISLYYISGYRNDSL